METMRMALTSVPEISAMAADTAATISGVTATRQVLPLCGNLREPKLFSRLFCVPRCS